MSALAANKLRLVGAVAGLNLLLMLAGWFLLISPQRNHEQSASQQLQQVQLAAARLVGGAATQTSHAKQPAIHTSGLYRLDTAMPVTADEPDLLLALNHLAKAAGVKVLTLSLQSPTAQIGYVTLPVQLSLSGTYASLTRYLHALRMLVGVRHGRVFAAGRLLSVGSVALAPNTGRTETATVNVDAFVFGSVAGTAPLSAASTTSTATSTTTTTTGG